MTDDTDWRLTGQEAYLTHVPLRRQRYRRYAANPKWDHDHCAFCHAKFMVEELPDVLHVGYCTLDEYHWICEVCFQDFTSRFGWTVERADES
jgi:hypothetical protein